MSTQTFFGTLAVIECCSCHCFFGMSKDMYERARDDGTSFCCPNGHSQSYTKNEVTRLREQVNRLTHQVEQREAAILDVQAQRNHERARAIVYRGHVTRIKNRVAKGVCPCCQRTFCNLARHMETKHPDYTERAP